MGKGNWYVEACPLDAEPVDWYGTDRCGPHQMDEQPESYFHGPFDSREDAEGFCKERAKGKDAHTVS